MPPPYDYNGVYAKSSPTGHGAVEIHTSIFEDEAANSTLKSAFSVQNVLMRNNLVEVANASATRMGVTTNKTLSAVNSAGKTVSRKVVSGVVRQLGTQSSKFNQVRGEPLYVLSSELSSAGMNCSSNLHDNANYQPSVCKTTAPSVTGAVLSCSTDGKLL
jgi:hypothetical protein